MRIRRALSVSLAGAPPAALRTCAATTGDGSPTTRAATRSERTAANGCHAASIAFEGTMKRVACDNISSCVIWRPITIAVCVIDGRLATVRRKLL